MHRLIRLFAATLLATVIFGYTALAQEAANETTGGDDPFLVAPKSETTAMEGHAMMEGTAGVGADLPGSGGHSILLPAAALLLGSGILGYTVAMRRR